MDAVRVLYLGGLERSGTTLVERAIGELPGVVPAGEVVHLWQRGLRDGERCACGEPFGRCPFWEAVGERAFGGWRNVNAERMLELAHVVDRTRFLPGLALRHWADRHRLQMREYTGYYVRLYRAVRDETGSQVVLDASMQASLAYCLSHDPEIDVRVLHVVRDSRAVAQAWAEQAGGVTEGGGTPHFSPGRTAMLWNAHNAAFSVLEPGTSRAQVMRVQYENFVADPVDTIRAVARFAGLTLQPGDLEYLSSSSVRVGPCHSAAGDATRFVPVSSPSARMMPGGP